MARAGGVAVKTRDRQLVAIAAAHLRGERDLVDALARDHLVDHPDNVLVAWIAAASHQSATRAQTRPRTRRRHEPQAHCDAADPRGRVGQRGLHRPRQHLQLPRRPRRARGQSARVVPRLTRRGERLVPGARVLGRAARSDRDRRRSTVRRTRRCASRCPSASPRPSCRSSACCAGRSSCPATRPTRRAATLRSRTTPATRSRPSATCSAPRIGETLGYTLTATWTVLVVVALGRRYAGRWFQVLGVTSAVLVFVGVFSPLGVPAIDTANFFGYVLWSVWLVAFGVADPGPPAPNHDSSAPVAVAATS